MENIIGAQNVSGIKAEVENGLLKMEFNGRKVTPLKIMVGSQSIDVLTKSQIDRVAKDVAKIYNLQAYMGDVNEEIVLNDIYSASIPHDTSLTDRKITNVFKKTINKEGTQQRARKEEEDSLQDIYDTFYGRTKEPTHKDIATETQYNEEVDCDGELESAELNRNLRENLESPLSTSATSTTSLSEEWEDNPELLNQLQTELKSVDPETYDETKLNTIDSATTAEGPFSPDCSAPLSNRTQNIANGVLQKKNDSFEAKSLLKSEQAVRLIASEHEPFKADITGRVADKHLQNNPQLSSNGAATNDPKEVKATSQKHAQVIGREIETNKEENDSIEDLFDLKMMSIVPQHHPKVLPNRTEDLNLDSIAQKGATSFTTPSTKKTENKQSTPLTPPMEGKKPHASSHVSKKDNPKPDTTPKKVGGQDIRGTTEEIRRERKANFEGKDTIGKGVRTEKEQLKLQRTHEEKERKSMIDARNKSKYTRKTLKMGGPSALDEKPKDGPSKAEIQKIVQANKKAQLAENKAKVEAVKKGKKKT